MHSRREIEKDWGTDEIIFFNPVVEVHKVWIRSGGKSSYGGFHHHRFKFNRIWVEEGLLKIFIKNKGRIIEILLDPKQGKDSIDIKPMVPHRFEALEETYAIEVYWAYCEVDDIIREKV